MPAICHQNQESQFSFSSLGSDLASHLVLIVASPMARYAFPYWAIAITVHESCAQVREPTDWAKLKTCLVEYLKHIFSVFKQHYTILHTFLPTHILK